MRHAIRAQQDAQTQPMDLDDREREREILAGDRASKRHKAPSRSTLTTETRCDEVYMQMWMGTETGREPGRRTGASSCCQLRRTPIALAACHTLTHSHCSRERETSTHSSGNCCWRHRKICLEADARTAPVMRVVQPLHCATTWYLRVPFLCPLLQRVARTIKRKHTVAAA